MLSNFSSQSESTFEVLLNISPDFELGNRHLPKAEWLRMRIQGGLLGLIQEHRQRKNVGELTSEILRTRKEKVLLTICTRKTEKDGRNNVKICSSEKEGSGLTQSSQWWSSLGEDGNEVKSTPVLIELKEKNQRRLSRSQMEIRV